jgi:hypothetical protein
MSRFAKVKKCLKRKAIKKTRKTKITLQNGLYKKVFDYQWSLS